MTEKNPQQMDGLMDGWMMGGQVIDSTYIDGRMSGQTDKCVDGD